MIERYSRPEMAALWSEESKYRAWLKVEILACEAQAQMGRIPPAALETIKRKADFNVKRILEIEETTRHDVIAFLTCVGEYVGPESRFIHLGLTSSDVLDTALAILLKEAMERIIADVDRLREALHKRALEHKHTVMIGRSHGIHAEPITFGLVLALWYEEMGRNRQRLASALKSVSVGKISGAVGTFAHLEPEVEEYVCRQLGLEPAPVSTQIVQRDRHAEYFNALALTAATIEKIALAIRHYQRTEVREAEEPFTRGQKGSSAMPHKRNPILAENLTGLARIVRANAMAALENVALWHERDISHSSVERVIGPDSTILVDFMLARLTRLIEGLVVYPDRMRRNLELTRGLIFSQDVLLLLVEKGMGREEAYAIVQENALRCWDEEGDFRRAILENKSIQARVPLKDLEAVFNVDRALRNVDAIFRRVFGE